MDQRIASLTPDQAEQTLNDFYNQLPPALFAEGKPALAALADVADRIREEAPAELRPFIEAVVDAPDPKTRGEVAKVILDQLYQYPGLRLYVDEALQRAAEPHMALPLIYPAVILVMTIVPSKIQFENGKLKSIEWDQFEKVAKLVHELTGFVNALPKGAWSWITGA